MEFWIWIGVGIVAWMFLSELRDIKDHLCAIRTMLADEVKQPDGMKGDIKWIAQSNERLCSIEQQRDSQHHRRVDPGS